MTDNETRPRKESFDQPRTRRNSFENSNANAEPSLIVEDKSPNERYVRSDELIMESAGGILLSYKAFDTNNGIETAWHKINLSAFDPEEQDRLRFSICTIEDLNSDVLIRYQDTWYSDDNQVVNIITTNLESLKEFISKVKTLRWRIVKKWCKQFLVGLQLLHSHTPAIIHRHFNFSHIYIDGGMGTTAIGDLWLAAFLERDSNGELQQMGLSENVAKLLTYMPPAYTAPESFEGNPLTTKVDIYCLGMCVLEMLASEEPYKECGGSAAKLRSKVLAGLPPQSLQRIQYHAAKDFITECLLPSAERPSAAELAKHEFLLPSSEDDDEIVIAPEKVSEYNSQRESASASVATAASGNAEDKRTPSGLATAATISAPPSTNRAHAAPLSSTSTEERRDALALRVEVAPGLAIPGPMQAPSPSPAPHLRSETASPATSTPSSPSQVQSADAAALMKVATDTKRGVGSTADGTKPPRTAVDLVSIHRNGDDQAPAEQAQFQLLISIPAELFRDGSVQDDKEVEFTFDCATDSYQVVSTEMVQELGLIMSVQALSMQISHMIERNLSKANNNSNHTMETSNSCSSPMNVAKEMLTQAVFVSSKGTPHSPSSKLESSLSNQVKGLAAQPAGDRLVSSLSPTSAAARPTVVAVTSPCTKALFTCCQADDTPSPQDGDEGDCVDSCTVATSPLQGSVLAFGDGPSSSSQTSEKSLPSPAVERVGPVVGEFEQTAQGVGAGDTSAVESANELPIMGSGPVSTLTVSIPSTGSVSINGCDVAVLQILPVEPPGIVALSSTGDSALRPGEPSKLTSISSGSLTVGAGTIPSNIDEQAVIGGAELQQELEKIDQDERVARRAFENRIQKLITIQEKCEEDILKLDVVYAEKNAELQKKHDRVDQQRDGDLARAEAELSLKLQDLKQRLLKEREREREASHPQ